MTAISDTLEDNPIAVCEQPPLNTRGRRLPFLSVKPGTLSNTSWLRRGYQVWTQHAQPWIRFSDGDVVFPQQPSLEEMPKFKDR